MAIDQKKVDAYIVGIRERFAETPKKLGLFERSLLRRWDVAVKQAVQADQEVRTIRQQIGQAQARINSLEVQHADLQGKASAYLEALIARKFEADFDDDVPEKPAKPSSPPKKKKTRSRGRSKRASKANSESASGPT